MRVTTWNCCRGFENKKKLPALLNEEPDFAIIQECSKDSVASLPAGYRSVWLAGPDKKGMALLFRDKYQVENLETAGDMCYFARVDVSGPERFRLIGAWNTPPQPGPSYIANLHQWLDAHEDWFNHPSVIFAGDLNSQAGASFDTGKRKHEDFENRLRGKSLVDAYVAGHAMTLAAREPTHRHTWNAEKPFYIDYIFVPLDLVPRLSSFSIGAPGFWSNLSDHSPVTATFQPRIL